MEQFMRGDVCEDDTSDEDGSDGDVDRPQRGEGAHSTKRAFIALALCPDISFGAVYEVLHFAYDLNLWSSLGAKRNLQTSVPMRVLLISETFRPL